MKNTHFAKQEYTYPRTLPLADFRTERYEQRFNIGPADRAVDRAGEDKFQRGSVTLLHKAMVSLIGTKNQRLTKGFKI